MRGRCELCGQSEHERNLIETAWGPIRVQYCPGMPRDRIVMVNPTVTGERI